MFSLIDDEKIPAQGRKVFRLRSRKDENTYTILVERSREIRGDECVHRSERFRRRELEGGNSRERERERSAINLGRVGNDDGAPTLPDPTGPMMQIKSPGRAVKMMFVSENRPF
jgi:hypothetical protein